jgi:hypothetical protein
LFQILQKYSKKFVSLQKQEKVIQELLVKNDIHKLSKLLSGRGMGKLIMSFPTAFARDQWFNKLLYVANGGAIGGSPEIVEEKSFKEVTVFQGIFEKAARNDEDGKLRGWRKRYFLLKSIHLSYYTKVNGEKKGTMRVLNGGVRVMDPEKELTGGKLYCLELEEGRDLSCVSPDLLEEARRHVRFAKIMEIERLLRKGIELQSVILLKKMLRFAKELEVMLDYELMNKAKSTLHTLQVKKLLHDLHSTSVIIPKSQRLAEYSDLAEEFMIDPNLASLKRVRALLGKTEIEQEIYRAKTSLMRRDAFSFVKSVKLLSRIDFHSSSLRMRSAYCSLICQFVGDCISELMVREGISLDLFNRFLKYCLTFSSSFHVELEVMDLIRIILKLTSRLSLDLGVVHENQSQNPLSTKSTTVNTNSNNIPSDMISLLDEMLNCVSSSSSSSTSLSSQYSIMKFPYLRLSSVEKQTKLLGVIPVSRRSSTANGGMMAEEVMNYSASPIGKSLLKYEGVPLDSAVSSEAFLILQVIMNHNYNSEKESQQSLTSQLKKWKKSKILQFAPSSIESVIFDLLHLANQRYPVIKDELYFQLAKQLRNNPSSPSTMKGLLLFSVYLHSFLPSHEAFPFIKNYLFSVRMALKQMKSLSQSSSNIHSPSKSDVQQSVSSRLCVSITDYCCFIICQHEAQFMRNNGVSSLPLLHCEKEFALRVFSFVFSNSRIPFNIVLMTGEIITLYLSFSQLTCQSLLIAVYEILFPSALSSLYRRKEKESFTAQRDFGEQIELFNEYDGNDRVTTSVLDDLSSSSINGYGTASASELSSDENERWNEILKVFDGFGFFFCNEEDFLLEDHRDDADEQRVEWNDDETSLSSYHHKPVLDFMSIPIQPLFAHLIGWNDDLQWKFLENYLSRPQTSFAHHSTFHHGNTVVFRRYLMDSNETLPENEVEIFQIDVSSRDQTQRNNRLKEWLTKSGDERINEEKNAGVEVVLEEVPQENVFDNLLPKDYLRVDLLFSEDTRYVNSRLSLMSDDCFHYLLALQISLAWIDGSSGPSSHVEKNRQTSQDLDYTLHSNRISHCSSSVLSCYSKRSVDEIVQQTEKKIQKRSHLISFKLQKKESLGNYNFGNYSTVNEEEGERKDHILEDDDDDDDGLLAAIDTTLDEEAIDDSDYQSTLGSDELNDIDGVKGERNRWKPSPIRKGQIMSEEEKQHLISLLKEVGISYPLEEGDDSETEEDGEEQRARKEKDPLPVNLIHLWRLIAEFHSIVVDEEMSGSDINTSLSLICLERYRYYMKKAYHHYLVTVTSPIMYDQYLIDCKLIAMELDETIQNEYLEFYEKFIKDFEKKDLLIGLSMKGMYFFSPRDWSIIFYSPFWDINEYELVKSTNNRSNKENKKDQLMLNINGLKLLLKGNKMKDMLELISVLSVETLRKGYFPYGTPLFASSFDGSLSLNSYHLHRNISSSSSYSENKNMSHNLFQLFLSSYSLLPLPPTIDSPASLKKNPFFLVAPSSQREIIAATRFEEEKLEEEIMKLAEQIQLEKNQQQITKGRSEFIDKSNRAEEDEEVEEAEGESYHDDNRKGSINHNKNVKLKRKNRSVFQGNRLKSNEEIFHFMQKERVDAVVCGVSNRESLFTQQFLIPSLPSKTKGKMKGFSNSSEISKDREEMENGRMGNNSSLLIKGFQNKPVIESQCFSFVSSPKGKDSVGFVPSNDRDSLPMVWSLGSDSVSASVFPSNTTNKRQSNHSVVKQPDLVSELENVWKMQKNVLPTFSLLQTDSLAVDVSSSVLLDPYATGLSSFAQQMKKQYSPLRSSELRESSAHFSPNGPFIDAMKDED